MAKKENKKLSAEKVEELKKKTEDKKDGEAKVKPVTHFRSILTIIK